MPQTKQTVALAWLMTQELVNLVSLLLLLRPNHA